MRRYLVLFIFLLVPSVCLAGGWFYGVASAPAGECVGDTCTGFLRCQNAEDTGYDNSETWSEYLSGGGASIDEDNATSPLRGDQSIVMYAGTSGNLAWCYNSLASSITSGYAHFMFSCDDYAPSAQSIIFAFRTTAGNDEIAIALNYDGTIRAMHGSAYDDSTETMSTGSYHVWMEWVNGASDGTMDVYVSSTTTKPASPWCSVTTGTCNTALDRVGLWAQATLTNKFDHILIDDSDIGTVCE